MEMLVRKINENELKETIDLVWKVFLKFEAPDYTKKGIEEFRSSINDSEFINKLEIYASFEDNKIIGTIATRNKNHIALFFVDENYQGKGIGRKLYDTVYRKNTDNFFTVNSSPYAKHIYEHLGFKCITEMQEVNGLKFYPMELIKE